MKEYSLNDLQVQHFRNAGYLKLNTVLPAITVNKLISKLNSDISEKIQPYKTDNNGNINRLDNIFNRGNIFKEVISHPMIIEPLISILGPNIEFTLNRHNHITINKQTVRKFHRDILQWSRSLVSVIIYLEESNTENGCTEIIPFSQFLPFHGTPNNGGTWLDENSKYHCLINQALPIPMPKGGILLFDSLAFHTAGENLSNNSRISITLGYHSVDELMGKENQTYKILLKGERLYRGNIELEQ